MRYTESERPAREAELCRYCVLAQADEDAARDAFNASPCEDTHAVWRRERLANFAVQVELTMFLQRYPGDASVTP